MDALKQMEVIGYLSEKRDILYTILTMTQRVNFRDNEDDPEKYIDLMGARQVLMDKIAEIDKKINKTIDTDVKLIDNFTKEVRGDASMISDNIKSLCAQILEIDKRNLEVSKRIMDKIKSNLQGLQKTKSIHRAYEENPAVYNRYFFDTKK